MFPLPPNEAAVIAELFRLFPGTREVTEGVGSVVPGRNAGEMGPSVNDPAKRAPSVTSHQSALFDNTREAA